MERRQEALARAPLFADLPKRHLREIARITGVRAFPEGETIIQEGSSGSSFFVVLEGACRVLRGRRTLARLDPGSFFGEISLLDPGVRTATVVTDAPTVCLDLAGLDFRDVLAREPSIALKVLREMARRLREVLGPLGG
jgi:CRP/FNR family transcriptional regulator, cyclic AMP receptor protein